MIRVALAEPKFTGGVGLELGIASYDELGPGDKERGTSPMQQQRTFEDSQISANKP